MGTDFTMLNKGDYLFLERFLDVSKANLFFANGLILVEGDAEALLIPTIAEVLDCSLVKHGVSVINVGSTAFLRYSKIFQRKNVKEGLLNIPVSIITDADVKPIEGQGQYKNKVIDGLGKNLTTERVKIEDRYNGQSVKTYVSKFWTLEYDLACSKLKKDFYLALLHAEYIKNSDKYGLTENKKRKALKRVEDDFARWETKWKDHDRKDRKIAFTIYNDHMLKKGKLKSITAQCFAQILKEKWNGNDAQKAELKSVFETDEHLTYLTNAIRNSVS
jgi:putative ATP-dependent endonuclease of OLD family